jgi:hypothetical protein
MKKAQKVQKIITVGDMRDQRAAADAVENAKHEQAAEAERNTRRFLQANPHVGMLVRKGAPVFYAYSAEGEYREGTPYQLAHCEAIKTKVILPPYWHDAPGYAERVRQLEAEDMTTSDAQGCADAEVMQGKHHGWMF